jgi:hypothetical protein
MEFESGQTAILIPVPEVVPLVQAWRERYDRAVRFGVPAHITVLYPFVDSSRLDTATIAEVRQLCGSCPTLEVTFRRCGRFPATLFLDPEPADRLRDLTGRFVDRWPDHPPYGGEHDIIVPHVTIADGADEATMAAIEDSIAGELPVSARFGAAWLFSFDGARWRPQVRLPFDDGTTRRHDGPATPGQVDW